MFRWSISRPSDVLIAGLPNFCQADFQPTIQAMVPDVVMLCMFALACVNHRWVCWLLAPDPSTGERLVSQQLEAVERTEEKAPLRAARRSSADLFFFYHGPPVGPRTKKLAVFRFPKYELHTKPWLLLLFLGSQNMD